MSHVITFLFCLFVCLFFGFFFFFFFFFLFMFVCAFVCFGNKLFLKALDSLTKEGGNSVKIVCLPLKRVYRKRK